MKIQKVSVALLAFVAVLSSCSVSNQNISASLLESDTLRVDIGMEPSTLDPAIAEDACAFRVINDLFAGLLDWNQSNSPVPGMASSWNLSADGKTYTFYLRKDLKFSDGTPITASDFVYSWKRLVDPRTASAYNFLLKDVVNAENIIYGKLQPDLLGVKAIDNYTFIVNLTHPNNAFLSYITVPDTFVVPRHVIEKYRDKWTDPRYIVTSGAYKLVGHVVNGSIIANRNTNFYAESQVKISNIEYFPYIDANVSLANYKINTLDTTWQNVPVDQYAKLKEQYKNELHTILWERLDYLVFNMNLPKYANNIKLRQALSMAIDRDIIVNNVLKSGQIPLYSVVTPTIEAGKYKDVKYRWMLLNNKDRLKKARELYKQAGYGVTNHLEVTLSYKTNDLYKKVALVIADMWSKELGIKVVLKNQEWKSLAQSLHRGDYDISLATWGADYNFVTTYTMLYMCDNPNNYAHYCNSNYDILVKNANKLLIKKDQEAMYKRALWLIMDSYSVIPLEEPAHQRLIKPRVHDYDIESNYLDNVQTKWMSLSFAN